MGKIFGALTGIFSEDNGNLSFMRVVTGMIVVVILFNWTWMNIKTGTLTPLGYEDLVGILGPLLIKMGQKGMEKTK